MLDPGVTEQNYWQQHMKEPEITSWRGIAFIVTSAVTADELFR